MSTATVAATTLEMTRTIRAPREKVYDAFVDEAQLAKWHCPRGMSVVAATVDPRVGGAWRIDMRSREQTAHVVGGVYREVKRPERLVYTWVWEPGGGPLGGVQTLVEVDFVLRDGGTEIRMRHSGFPAEAARDGHAQGWASVFNRLNDLLDPSGTAGTLTLYGDGRSSYTRSARMGLVEKGLAYAHETVQPHSDAVDAIHPFGLIPALRDGSTEIWETSAILRYIDEAFEGPSLNPGMVVDRARTETWVSATGAYLYDTMVRRYVLQYLFPAGDNGQRPRGDREGSGRDGATARRTGQGLARARLPRRQRGLLCRPAGHPDPDLRRDVPGGRETPRRAPRDPALPGADAAATELRGDAAEDGLIRRRLALSASIRSMTSPVATAGSGWLSMTSRPAILRSTAARMRSFSSSTNCVGS
jgi:glutathione S-transferase